MTFGDWEIDSAYSYFSESADIAVSESGATRNIHTFYSHSYFNSQVSYGGRHAINGDPSTLVPELAPVSISSPSNSIHVRYKSNGDKDVTFVHSDNNGDLNHQQVRRVDDEMYKARSNLSEEPLGNCGTSKTVVFMRAAPMARGDDLAIAAYCQG